MISFKIHQLIITLPLQILSFLLLGLSTLSTKGADRITFLSGNELSGKILNITDTGSVQFLFEHAKNKAFIKPSSLNRIFFDQSSSEAPPKHHQRVGLINGDILSGDILSFDLNTLVIDPWYSAPITIQRANLSWIKFGILDASPVYSAPYQPDEWINETSAWEVEKKSFKSLSNGSITLKRPTPLNFIVRFKISWQTTPNLRFYLCSEFKNPSEQSDRYSFQCHSQGIQYSRQLFQDRFVTKALGKTPFNPTDYPDKTIQVEIRVDREQNIAYLYLNGQREDIFLDYYPHPPQGDYFIIESNHTNEHEHQVSDLSIYPWDGKNHLDESLLERQEPGDLLLEHEGNQYLGSCLGIVTQNKQSAIALEHPFSEEPLFIPLEKISLLQLKERNNSSPPTAPFIFELSNGGRLLLNKVRLEDSQIILEHPLLGPLSFNRKALKSMTSTHSK